MTVMTSWELFEDMRAAQDDMAQMNRGWAWRNGQQYGGATGRSAWAPAVDISESQDAYLVAADLPGVRTGEVEITFADGLLTIQGERHHASAAEGQQVHRAERCYGPFRRSITLPSHVDADKIEASAQDGVLQVRVPKAKGVRAKRIEVRAGKGHASASAGTAAKNGS